MPALAILPPLPSLLLRPLLLLLSHSSKAIPSTLQVTLAQRYISSLHLHLHVRLRIMEFYFWLLPLGQSHLLFNSALACLSPATWFPSPFTIPRFPTTSAAFFPAPHSPLSYNLLDPARHLFQSSSRSNSSSRPRQPHPFAPSWHDAK